MIRPVLFLVLGAAGAALLALLAVPALLRRARAAERRRLEASLPLTLNEIEAGKDALRADFAVAASRLEADAKTLRDRHDEQAVAAGRAQAELGAARAEAGRLSETLAALETSRNELQAALAAERDVLRERDAQLAGRGEELRRLEKLFEETTYLASSRQIDLVARETEIERLGEELAAMKKAAEARETDLTAARNAVAAAEERGIDLTQQLEAARGQALAGENRVERLREDLAGARKAAEALEGELAASRAGAAAAGEQGTELARQVVRMGSELSAAKDQADRLAEDLGHALKKSEALERELAAAKAATAASEERGADLRRQVEATTAELFGVEQQVERQRGEEQRWRKAAQAAEAEGGKLREELVEAQKERMGLEVELEALRRQLTGLFPGFAPGGDPARALAAAAAERDRLEARLAALDRENKDSRARLAAASLVDKGSPDDALREEMLALAARVTALAVRLEGPGGAIGQALDMPEEQEGPHPSLADRIRALLRETERVGRR